MTPMHRTIETDFHSDLALHHPPCHIWLHSLPQTGDWICTLNSFVLVFDLFLRHPLWIPPGRWDGGSILATSFRVSSTPSVMFVKPTSWQTCVGRRSSCTFTSFRQENGRPFPIDFFCPLCHEATPMARSLSLVSFSVVPNASFLFENHRV